jgi:hypothetical protein
VNLTELAHWTYRTKAIPAEIAETERLIKGWRETRPWMCNPEPTEKQTRDHEKWVAEWQHDMDGLQEKLNFEKYLLEEAKYYVILGQLVTGIQDTWYGLLGV